MSKMAIKLHTHSCIISEEKMTGTIWLTLLMMLGMNKYNLGNPKIFILEQNQQIEFKKTMHTLKYSKSQHTEIIINRILKTVIKLWG